MSLICVSKEWHELTIQELYKIIQLRIEGFIVQNKTCYQDLEAYYDHNGWYNMYYDTALGMHPQSMVGQTQFCTLKTFYGSDGTAYNYPAWRRQTWVPGYRNPFHHFKRKKLLMITSRHFLNSKSGWTILRNLFKQMDMYILTSEEREDYRMSLVKIKVLHHTKFVVV